MENFLVDYYLIVKAFHIVFVISWMAGLLYLPRLFVYHTKAKLGSELDTTFRTMESKLVKIIINPAMILSLIFGLLLININGFASMGGWFHAKLLLLLFMFGFHGVCIKWKKGFALGKNRNSEKFYRIANEIPAVLMTLIVALAVIKPF